MHMIKVEIGGDGQSTDGTEASHMHSRDDLSCKRGYEFWLLQEARKRQPKIKTYALSWASPYWVGNQTGYYSQDEIDYHIKWLECTKEWDIGPIDYMGNWNERSYGPAAWTVQFRAAMDAAGFKDTQIIIPDGGDNGGIEKVMDSDPAFKSAVAGIGLHYPCNRPAANHDEIQVQMGKKYWSSEDYSTVGNWDGAACWGRLLNQNYVRMNQTATISWSLIWSVYAEGFSYFGNGLMYAMTPWSGFYEAGQLGAMGGSDNGAAIWTNAHVCQFVEPGWRYLSVTAGGSGMLTSGGSFVAMVSPTGHMLRGAEGLGTQVTLVAEKLEGRCLRCSGQTTSTETVTFKLDGALAGIKTMQMWVTNQTSHFLHMGNITAASTGTFSFVAPKDGMVTLSSWFNGQTKGTVSAPIGTDTPFPTKLVDDFDQYPVDAEARFFADNGGSFQVAKDPGNSSNMVLKQWVEHENGVNRWGRNVPPISLLGNNSWNDLTVGVDVQLHPGPPLPPPPLPTTTPNWQNSLTGLCLDTQGQSVAPASTVDVWSCVKADNEAFVYDADHHLVGQHSKRCLSVRGCVEGAGACIQDCAPGTDEWILGPKDPAGYQTISPKATNR